MNKAYSSNNINKSNKKMSEPVNSDILKFQQYKINNPEYIKSKAEINLDNEYANLYKYLKDFIDGKNNKERGNYAFNQTSKSSNQKSQMIKSDEKIQNLKITFQQLLNYEDKTKPVFPSIILIDEELNIKTTYKEKIEYLLNILENYNDTIIEREYCKNIQDRLILEIYTILSQKSFKLYSIENKEKAKYIRKYLIHLAGNIQYDMIGCPNSTLNYINQNLINIEDLKKEKLELTIENKDNLYFEYDEDDIEERENLNNLINIDKSSITDNLDEEKEDEIDNDILVPAEEINEDEQHKLIFYDDTRKDTENKIKKTEEIEYIPKEEYLNRKEKIMKLRQTAYEDIIDIINTDNIYLPKSKVSLSIEEIKQYIDEMKKRIDVEGKNIGTKNSIFHLLESFSDSSSSVNDSLNSNNQSVNLRLKNLKFHDTNLKNSYIFFQEKEKKTKRRSQSRLSQQILKNFKKIHEYIFKTNSESNEEEEDEYESDIE
jgi:hypothetical protein